MASLNEWISGIGTVSSQAAGWYSGLTGKNVIVPPVTPQIAAQQEIAIRQRAEANLGTRNPTLAGLLANPTVIVVLGLLALALIIFALRK